MNNLNLLIKPSSGNCNLKCDYCFYSDVSDNRSIKNYGFMSFSTAKKLIIDSFNTNAKIINFAFQGGEPTLIGIDFFYFFHKTVEEFNVNNLPINFSIQSNGTLFDKNWILLFKKYNYLVGVSLDGNKSVHDNFRKSHNNKGTFSLVLKNIKLLQKNSINFNILSVVNKKTVQSSEDIYNFFKKLHFNFLQFIPCLDKLQGDLKEDFSLTDTDYGVFLDTIFNLWYKDFKNGKYISIRFFDNLFSLLLNNYPESCDMLGHCSINSVVEADGSVYPCDFYVLDEFNLGNINNSNLLDLISSNKALDFVRSSFFENNECSNCTYIKLCRTGCKRYKEPSHNYKNKFCNSFKFFYSKNFLKLIEVSNILRYRK